MPMGPSSCAASTCSSSSSGNGCGETRDRFIPCRSSMCMDRSNCLMSKENDRSTAAGGSGDGSPAAALAESNRRSDFNKVLECNLLGAPASGQDSYSVLTFQIKRQRKRIAIKMGSGFSTARARAGWGALRGVPSVVSPPRPTLSMTTTSTFSRGASTTYSRWPWGSPCTCGMPRVGTSRS